MIPQTQNDQLTKGYFFYEKRIGITRWITEISTRYTNFLLRKRVQQYTLEDYSQMPENSLGATFYAYLKRHNIPFTPNLIRHDLKHILLDYEMTMPDELRIHAFLVGNGASNLMSKLYLMICLSITPEEIKRVIPDFHRGKKAKTLAGIDLQTYATHQLQSLKRKLL